MDAYIDIKYLSLISPQLQQFKKKSDFLWNFRCPYCGDSQKSRTKARGFVYRKKNDLFYKCHNCGVGTTLGTNATATPALTTSTSIPANTTVQIIDNPIYMMESDVMTAGGGASNNDLEMFVSWEIFDDA